MSKKFLMVVLSFIILFTPGFSQNIQAAEKGTYVDFSYACDYCYTPENSYKVLNDKVAVGIEALTLATWLDNYRGSRADDKAVMTRFMPYVDTQLTDMVSFKVMPGIWGIWRDYDIKYTALDFDYAPENGDVKLLNGYVKLRDIWGGLSFILGRQFWGEEEDALFYFGPHKGRFLEVSAFDAVRVEKAFDKFYANAFWGRRAKLKVALGNEDSYDSDLAGAEIFSTPNFLENHFLRMGAYYRGKEDESTATVEGKRNNLYLLTFKANGLTPIPRLEYGFLAGLDFGKNDTLDQDYLGYIVRIQGKQYLDLSDLAKAKLTGGWVYVSGDDPDTSKDENFHRISRDCFFSMALLTYEILNDTHPENVSNVVIPYCGAEISPNILDNNLTLGVRGAWLDTAEAIKGHKGKGTEYNVYAEYKFNEHLGFDLIYARFKPKGILEASWTDKWIDQVSLYANITF